MANAPGFIYVFDHTRKEYVYISDKLQETIGFSEDELGMEMSPVRERIHEDDIPALAARRDRILSDTQNDDYECDHRFRHKDGHWVHLHTVERVFERSADGQVLQTVGFARDVTAHFSVQEKLTSALRYNEFLLHTARMLSEPRSEYRSNLQQLAKAVAFHFNAVVDVSILDAEKDQIIPEAVYHADKDVLRTLRKVFKEQVVKVGEGLVGYVFEHGNEVLLNPVPDQKRESFREKYPHLVPEALIYRPLRGADGTIGSLNITRLEGQPLFTPEEEDQIRQLANHLSLFVENALLHRKQRLEIAYRKRIEEKLERSTEELKRSEAATRDILNTVPIYIAKVDLELRYTFANETYRRMSIDPQTLVGTHLQDVFSREAFEHILPNIERALKGETLSYDFTGPMQDGNVRHMHIILSPSFSKDGSIDGIFSCATDLTERLEAEQEARQAQKRFEKLTLNSGDAYFFHDLDQRILEVNKAATEMLGYGRDELLSIRASKVDPRWAESREYVKKLETVDEGVPTTMETIVYHRDGTAIPVEVRLIKLVEDGKVYIQSLLRDRSEAKRQEQLLKRSEERLRLIFDNVEDYIAVIAADGTFESINKTSQGLNQESVIGTSVFTFYDDGEQLERVHQQFESLKKNGGAFELEDAYTGPDGTVRLYSRKFIAIMHEGHFYRALLIIRDVTSDRIRERMEMEALIRGQEQERKRLGSELHDGIGQILSSISLDVSQAHKAEPAYMTDALKNIEGKVQEAIRETRNISHDLMPEVLEGFGLGEAVRQVCNTLQKQSTIRVNLDVIDVQTKYHSAIEMNMYRVLQEAMTNVYRHAQCRNVFVSLVDHGTTLFLSVEDDGIGFDVEAESTGIGLRNIASRVAVIEGDLTIESSPEKGTLLQVEVPKNTQV